MNKIEDLYCILYISTMKEDYSKEQIIDMLKLFQEKNNKNGISGLMLYHEKNVIQYLEGDKEDLYRLYNNIENDCRHYHIIKIMDEKITKRNFVNWDLGFKELSFNEFLKFSLDKLLFTNTNTNINRKKIKLFFKQFIDSFY